MPRTTGNYRNSTVAGETVRAFVPATLPPDGPPLRVELNPVAVFDERKGPANCGLGCDVQHDRSEVRAAHAGI